MHKFINYVVFSCLIFLALPHISHAEEQVDELEALGLVKMFLPSTGKAHTIVPLQIEINRDFLPENAMLNVIVKRITGPEDGVMDVLSGVPITDLTFNKEGEYTLEATVGFTLKST